MNNFMLLKLVTKSLKILQIFQKNGIKNLTNYIKRFRQKKSVDYYFIRYWILGFKHDFMEKLLTLLSYRYKNYLIKESLRKVLEW